MPASRSLPKRTLPKRTPAALVIVAAAAALGAQNIEVQRYGSRFDVQYELPNGPGFAYGGAASKEEALNWVKTSIPSNLLRFPTTA